LKIKPLRAHCSLTAAMSCIGTHELQQLYRRDG
jgi:hypothetical protein